ncbi:MAG: 50S ribosomal protein L9, partial [Chloroflexia bacterium]
AVPGLGDAGAVKEVADGYARNYLLPRKLAVTATRGSLKQAEAQADVYARRAQKAASAAQGASAAVEGKTVKIRARVGSENRLYGSVTAADVAEALLTQYGIDLDRRKIAIDEAIHRTGTYSASADFGQGVSARFTVEVAPEVAGASGKATRAAEAAEPAEVTEPEQAAMTEASEAAPMMTAEDADAAAEDTGDEQAQG